LEGGLGEKKRRNLFQGEIAAKEGNRGKSSFLQKKGEGNAFAERWEKGVTERGH